MVLQDQGTVKNDQGMVQYDQVQVGYCHIASPIAGRVGLRLVDPGTVMQSSDHTLGVITQLHPSPQFSRCRDTSLRCSTRRAMESR